MTKSKIASVSSYVPEMRQQSRELEKELCLPEGWIRQRTGVEQCAVAAPEQAVSDLATNAAKNALKRLAVNDAATFEFGTLILATSTPDYLLPPTAPKIASNLGLGSVAAFDIAVACCGFLYATILADSIVRTQQKPVLVVGANILTRRCRPDDKTTRPIFADAAGAVVFAPTESDDAILSFVWQSDGTKAECLTIPDGGSRSPFNDRTFQTGSHFMRLNDGAAIFKYAVESMACLGRQAVDDAGFNMDEIDWWIPHQANLRIIESTRKMLRLDRSKTLMTLQQFGNSSAATIPVTLDYFLHDNDHCCVKSGDLVLMTAAAAGMTSAAVLARIP